MSFEYERLPPVQGLRLHLNENTAGCSPRVVAALRAIEAADIAKYPDYDEAVDACARYFGVPAATLVVTNGLDEGLLGTAIAALCARGPEEPVIPEAIVIEPAFDMYAACSAALGARVVRVMPRPDFSFPLDEVLSAMTPDTRLAFVTSPNNPTGLVVARAAIRAILDALPPSALLLLDEAYADFSAETFIDELPQHANLVIGRTFAKAHGLAGLRAGAVLGNAPAIDRIRGAVPPYSLNVAIARALAVALDDREHVRRYVAESADSRRLIADACARLGLDTWPSAANFMLVRVGPRAAEVADALAARGVHVRDRSHQPGCAGCLRMTAGWVTDTKKALAVFEEVLCGEP